MVGKWCNGVDQCVPTRYAWWANGATAWISHGLNQSVALPELFWFGKLVLQLGFDVMLQLTMAVAIDTACGHTKQVAHTTITHNNKLRRHPQAYILPFFLRSFHSILFGLPIHL